MLNLCVRIKKTAVLCLFCVSFFMISHVAVAAELVVNKIAAIVNGEIITNYDVQERSARLLQNAGLDVRDAKNADAIHQIQMNVVEEMIAEMLITQEAVKRNITIAEADIDNELQGMLTRLQISKETLEHKLQLDGRTLQDYRDMLKKNMMRQRVLSMMVGRKVVITQEEITEYYNEHKNDFVKDKTVDLRVLVVDGSKNLETLLAPVRDNNASFADIVRQYSIGPAAEDGGFLGTFTWNSLAEQWKDSIVGVAEGHLGKILWQNGQQAVLFVEKLSDGSHEPLDAVAEKIENLLREPRLQKLFDEYNKKLRECAVIDIRF